MSTIKDDMNRAAAAVLKDHWDKNQNLTALIVKLAGGTKPHVGAGLMKSKGNFYTIELSSESAYGVKILHKVDLNTSISLTLGTDGKYSYEASSVQHGEALNYSGESHSGNGAINHLHAWVAAVGIARDEDLHAKVAREERKAQPAAPLNRNIE